MVNFAYGIRSYVPEVQDESKQSGSWFTALRCEGVFKSCLQAVVFDWMGEGSIINAVIQPRTTTNPKEIHLTEKPLVRIQTACRINSFFWDLSTARNKYALEIIGMSNVIYSVIDPQYIKCSNILNNTFTHRQENLFSFSGVIHPGSLGIVPQKTPYDNTNDFAKNAGNNLVSLYVDPPSKFEDVKKLLSGEKTNFFYGVPKDPNNPDEPDVSSELVIELAFPQPIALRTIAIGGQPIPSENIRFEYYGFAKEVNNDIIKDENGNEILKWHDLKTSIQGIDYEDKNGQETYAWWQYSWYNDQHIQFGDKFARKVRITMMHNSGVYPDMYQGRCSITKIYVGAVDINMPVATGDNIVATSLKIKGTDGKYYNITVNNGQLDISEFNLT